METHEIRVHGRRCACQHIDVSPLRRARLRRCCGTVARGAPSDSLCPVHGLGLSPSAVWLFASLSAVYYNLRALIQGEQEAADSRAERLRKAVESRIPVVGS